MWIAGARLVCELEVGEELRSPAAAVFALGDLLDADAVAAAMRGASQVLHICPPMHPQEDAIGRTMIAQAIRQGVERFVLYSVLHPLLADVPHHDRKLEAERALVGSGIAYTILQPSRYMQHLLPIWKVVRATGVHSMPFGTSARFSLVDLDDLADAAARILIETGHEAATYELAGPEALSQDDMARILSLLLERPIRAQFKPLEEFRREAAAGGLPAERIDTMCRMNAHYDMHGLTETECAALDPRPAADYFPRFRAPRVAPRIDSSGYDLAAGPPRPLGSLPRYERSSVHQRDELGDQG